MSSINNNIDATASALSNTPLKPGHIFNKVTSATLIAGFVILFLTIGSGGNNATMGRIIGLGFVLVGLILFMAYTIQKLVRTKNNESKNITSLITTLGPFLPCMGLLIWAIVIYSDNFDYIAKGKLTPSFTMFETFLVIINLILVYMFYKNIHSKEFQDTQRINKVSGMLIYAVEIIYLVIVISMYIIIRFFSTDGFTNNNKTACDKNKRGFANKR